MEKNWGDTPSATLSIFLQIYNYMYSIIIGTNANDKPKFIVHT